MTYWTLATLGTLNFLKWFTDKWLIQSTFDKVLSHQSFHSCGPQEKSLDAFRPPTRLLILQILIILTSFDEFNRILTIFYNSLENPRIFWRFLLKLTFAGTNLVQPLDQGVLKFSFTQKNAFNQCHVCPIFWLHGLRITSNHFDVKLVWLVGIKDLLNVYLWINIHAGITLDKENTLLINKKNFYSDLCLWEIRRKAKESCLLYVSREIILRNFILNVLLPFKGVVFSRTLCCFERQKIFLSQYCITIWSVSLLKL